MNNIVKISLIGAGLVIIGLIILWVLMEVLVQLTQDKKQRKNDPDQKKELERFHQQKAAAAATAVSIALLKSSFLLSEQQIDQGLTAWQSTNRHEQLHNLPDRKLSKRNNK